LQGCCGHDILKALREIIDKKSLLIIS